MSRTDTRSARSTALRRYAETHHVDQIRPEARYGGPWGQFIFWLGGNFNVFNVVLGAVVVEIGLAFWWALIAIGAGTVIGAVLIALHASQGPRLGVPQSIQSRRPVRLLRLGVDVHHGPGPEHGVHRGRASHPGAGDAGRHPRAVGPGVDRDPGHPVAGHLRPGLLVDSRRDAGDRGRGRDLGDRDAGAGTAAPAAGQPDQPGRPARRPVPRRGRAIGD